MKDYNDFAKTFANSRRNMYWPELDYFVEYQNNSNALKNPNLKILDIGCGSGRLLNFLNKLDIEFSYLGLDSSSGMIEEAKKEFLEYNFGVLDMQELDSIEDKFDLIFFIASFHHLDSENKRQKVLSEVKKLLKPDGIIFLTNWNLLGEKNFNKYKKSHQGGGDFLIKIGDFSRYYHGFELGELEELYKESGFKIIENRVFDNSNNIVSILKYY